LKPVDNGNAKWPMANAKCQKQDQNKGETKTKIEINRNELTADGLRTTDDGRRTTDDEEVDTGAHLPL